MKKTLVCMGIGATLMYFFDPESGEARRSLLRETFQGLLPQTKDALSHKAEAVVAKANELTGQVDNAAAEKIDALGSEVLSVPENSGPNPEPDNA